MYEFTFSQANVYACQIDSNNFYPWLLQLVGLESDPSSPGYRNYFFKFVKEDDVFKTHKFSSLTDSNGGSIQPKQNEDNLDRLLKAYPNLKAYFESLKASASAAWYYEFKESSYDSYYSEIEPDNLASYLQGESDKQHKNVSESVSQDYEATSFSSYSGSVPSFEITLKGKFSGVDELSEKSVTYVYESGSAQFGSVQLKQKGSSQVFSLPSGGVSLPGSHQHSQASSSPDIIGIVCGSLIGLATLEDLPIDSNNFYPWLLQLVGLESDPSSPGYRNYFFKFVKEDDVFKTHKFSSLTDSNGGSIQPKQNEDNLDRLLKAYPNLKAYFESLKASASAAWYYEFKESSYDSYYSEIEPDNLASYLQGESDKQHKCGSGSGSEDYEVTSFTSYSGSVPSFEITLKGKVIEQGGSSESDEYILKSVTYVYTSNESGQLKQKGDSHGVSLSGLPSSVPSPGVSVQHSHVSSSPDIIGIVCGSLVGLATLEDLPIDSNNFYPWLLQLVGLESDPSSPGYRNYFFKFVKEDDVFKTHKFSSLTDSNGGSIQPKQNEDNLDRLLKAYPNLKAYFESLKASASAAWYYVYKEFSTSSYYSEIDPKNLYSYLKGESDKQHKCGSGSGSEDYEVTSFTSYSGSVPSFEITLKGKVIEQGGSSESDEYILKSVTYVYTSNESGQLKQKGDSHGVSLSGLPSSVPSPGVSVQHSHVSSSPDIIGIVCGSLVGLATLENLPFNDHDFTFESNEAFMSVNPNQVVVYACQIGSDFHPWLLQLVIDDNSNYRNYFFKLVKEDDVFKTHKFSSLTVPSGSGSIQHKQNEDNLEAYSSLNSDQSLKAYISQLQKSASAASGYVYKSYYGSSSSEIQPKNLASYLGDSDKQHKYVSGSGSEEYSVTSFSSGSDSGSVPSFEITLKGRQTKKSGGSSEESFTYESSSVGSGQLKQTGDSHGFSGLPGSPFSQLSPPPPQSTQEFSPQASSPSLQASSSPNVLGIVCGSLIGLATLEDLPIGSKYHPWLLQLVGYYYDSSSVLTTVNYFFKLVKEDDVFKTHKFSSLTVPSGSGSIERKQNEDNLEAYSSLNSDQSLKAYISNLKSSGGSAATYYVYKSYYGSSSSEIEPDNLASYLQGESDKKHKYGSESVSQEYSVTSFSSGSYSGSVPSFEITLKERQTKKSGGLSEKSFTYESSTTQFGSGQLKLKGDSFGYGLPGIQVSGLLGGVSSRLPSGGSSPGGSPQIFQASSPSLQASSSLNVLGIVCGSLIGLATLEDLPIGSKYHPWLLQLVGYSSGSSSGYLNYFFKRDEDDIFKTHKFSSLTVPSGSGSIQHKQDNLDQRLLQSNTELKAYFDNLTSSGASPATYYLYKSYYYGSSYYSEIDPDNLYSYLKGESDKKHKHGSASQEYSVTSFSSGSYSGSVPSFEITLKGRQTKKSGGLSEKSFTYVYDKNKSQLTEQGSTTVSFPVFPPGSLPSGGVSLP
ncbi:uncharacterized protein BdWA1_004200 [Babesia duncani]|uniref:Uncharacterized protein n=1 Tax=Babesia duncani TaxID=323732 RepID=A0AAD9UM06_9APIC|nr:hypothetical protein BdWA1_004200 [Babesia duncani]